MLFALYAHRLVFTDPFDDSAGIPTHTLFSALYALVIIAILANVVFMFVSVRKRKENAASERTKKCFSCGQTMDVSEPACPKCRSIQPYENK